MTAKAVGWVNAAKLVLQCFGVGSTRKPTQTDSARWVTRELTVERSIDVRGRANLTDARSDDASTAERTLHSALPRSCMAGCKGRYLTASTWRAFLRSLHGAS